MTTVRLVSDSFDLARLRGAFSDEFQKWDLAVRDRNTQLAKQARASIRRMAFKGLANEPGSMGGFYLFLDSSGREGPLGLTYIGIADGPQRPIGRRIVDRLRDDSAVDVQLDLLDPAIARGIVHDRLVRALPGSGQNYVGKHLKVAELFRRSSTVVLIGCTEPKLLIRETEKLLISSAAAAGAPLANKQHVRFRGVRSGRAFILAEAVIGRASAHGLPYKGVEKWHRQLMGDGMPSA